MGQSNIKPKSRQKAFDIIQGEIDQSGFYRLGILTRKREKGTEKE